MYMHICICICMKVSLFMGRKLLANQKQAIYTVVLRAHAMFKQSDLKKIADNYKGTASHWRQMQEERWLWWFGRNSTFTGSMKFYFKDPEIKCESLSGDDIPSFLEMQFMQVYSSCLGIEINSSTLKDFDRAVRHVSAGRKFAGWFFF